MVEALVAAVQAAPGIRVLDLHSDRDHNRSVLSLAGDEASLKDGLMRLFEAALGRIDLRTQQGCHPRLGAVDVLPFIPIEDATMADCVALARDVAAVLSLTFGVPTYLYEEAASAPHRRNLEDVRRGGFEGLARKMLDPAWKPDFGEAAPHPSAGATAVGARGLLVAYNINLATPDVAVARAIAKSIRFSSDGSRFVKAMGVKLEERNLAQVSINVTDHKRSPLFSVFEMVRSEAARHGVDVAGSEIVGLAPADALIDAAAEALRIQGFSKTKILEERLRETMTEAPRADSKRR